MREDVLGASSSRGHTPRGRGNLLSAQGRVSGSGWMGVMEPEWEGDDGSYEMEMTPRDVLAIS